MRKTKKIESILKTSDKDLFKIKRLKMPLPEEAKDLSKRQMRNMQREDNGAEAEGEKRKDNLHSLL